MDSDEFSKDDGNVFSDPSLNTRTPSAPVITEGLGDYTMLVTNNNNPNSVISIKAINNTSTIKGPVPSTSKPNTSLLVKDQVPLKQKIVTLSNPTAKQTVMLQTTMKTDAKVTPLVNNEDPVKRQPMGPAQDALKSKILQLDRSLREAKVAEQKQGQGKLEVLGKVVQKQSMLVAQPVISKTNVPPSGMKLVYKKSVGNVVFCPASPRTTLPSLAPKTSPPSSSSSSYPLISISKPECPPIPISQSGPKSTISGIQLTPITYVASQLSPGQLRLTVPGGKIVPSTTGKIVPSTTGKILNGPTIKVVRTGAPGIPLLTTMSKTIPSGLVSGGSAVKTVVSATSLTSPGMKTITIAPVTGTGKPKTLEITKPLKGFNIAAKPKESSLLLTPALVAPEISKDPSPLFSGEGQFTSKQSSTNPSELFLINSDTDRSSASDLGVMKSPMEVHEVLEIVTPDNKLTTDQQDPSELKCITPVTPPATADMHHLRAHYSDIITLCLHKFSSLVLRGSLSLRQSVETLSLLLDRVFVSPLGVSTLGDKAFFVSLKRRLQNINLINQLSFIMNNMNLVCANLNLNRVSFNFLNKLDSLKQFAAEWTRDETSREWCRESIRLKELCASPCMTDSESLRHDLQSFFMNVTSFMESVLEEIKDIVRKFINYLKEGLGLSLAKGSVMQNARYPSDEIYQTFVMLNKERAKIEKTYRNIMARNGATNVVSVREEVITLDDEDKRDSVDCVEAARHALDVNKKKIVEATAHAVDVNRKIIDATMHVLDVSKKIEATTSAMDVDPSTSQNGTVSIPTSMGNDIEDTNCIDTKTHDITRIVLKTQKTPLVVEEGVNKELDSLCEELEQAVQSPVETSSFKDQETLIDLFETSPEKNETSLSDDYNAFVISSEEEEDVIRDSRVEKEGEIEEATTEQNIMKMEDKPVKKYMSPMEQFVQKYRTSNFTKDATVAKLSEKTNEIDKQNSAKRDGHFDKRITKNDNANSVSGMSDAENISGCNIETICIEDSVKTVEGKNEKIDPVIPSTTDASSSILVGYLTKPKSPITTESTKNLDTLKETMLPERKKHLKDHDKNTEDRTFLDVSKIQKSEGSNESSRSSSISAPLSIEVNSDNVPTITLDSSLNKLSPPTTTHPTSVTIMPSSHSSTTLEHSTLKFVRKSLSPNHQIPPNSLATTTVNIIPSSSSTTVTRSGIPQGSALVPLISLSTSHSSCSNISVTTISKSAHSPTPEFSNSSTTLNNSSESSAAEPSVKSVVTTVKKFPHRELIEEIKQVFAREQLSLNNKLSKVAKLSKSSGIVPASKITKIPEASKKLDELKDEITIIDTKPSHQSHQSDTSKPAASFQDSFNPSSSKEIANTGDMLKIRNVQRINDLSCNEQFVEESINDQDSSMTQKSGEDNKGADEVLFHYIDLATEDSANKKQLPPGNQNPSFEREKHLEKQSLGREKSSEILNPDSEKLVFGSEKSTFTERDSAGKDAQVLSLTDEDEIQALPPDEDVPDSAEHKRRLRLMKQRYLSQQRDQALETACLQGMKAQAMGFRTKVKPLVSLLTDAASSDGTASGQEDSPDGPNSQDSEEPQSKKARVNKKQGGIRPLSHDAVMGNRRNDGVAESSQSDDVKRDRMGNRVYSEADFYPCCFKLKSKGECTCPTRHFIYNNEQNPPSNTESPASTSSGTHKRKQDGESVSSSSSKRRKAQGQANPSEIFCCESCGCYGDLSEFISEKFCSEECQSMGRVKIHYPASRRISEGTSKVNEGASKISEGGSENSSRPSSESSVSGEKPKRSVVVEKQKKTKKAKPVAETLSSAGAYRKAAAEWSWKAYYAAGNGRPAPFRAFRNEPSKLGVNQFRVGYKMEAKDPQMESRICVVTCVEVKGPRIRLHFDGYPDRYDYWANACSPDLYPAGWNAQFHRRIVPPPVKSGPFSWSKYLQTTRSTAAPESCFTCTHMPPSVFKIKNKLEAVNKKGGNKFHVATVRDVIGPRVHIHLDGLSERYDYWTDIGSMYIRSVGYCRRNNKTLVAPPGERNFNWDSYLNSTNSDPVPEEGFLVIPLLNSFEKGQKVEAVDPRVPSLIRVATVIEVEEMRIKLSFDGFPSYLDYWVYYDSVNVHPPGWCERSGHPLEPPVGGSITPGPCGTPGCAGRGHIEQTEECHYNTATCPYSQYNINRQEAMVWERFDGETFESLLAPLVESKRKYGGDAGQDSQLLSPPSIVDEDSCGGASSLMSDGGGSEEDEEVNVEVTNSERGSGAKKLKKALQRQSSSKTSSVHSSSSAAVPKPSSPVATAQSQAHLNALREAMVRSLYSAMPRALAPACSVYWSQHTQTLGLRLDERPDPVNWSEEDVVEFVRGIPDCEPLASVFQELYLDGPTFLLLSQSDLQNILHLKIGHAIKIYNAILLLRQKSELMRGILFNTLDKEETEEPMKKEMDDPVVMDSSEPLKKEIDDPVVMDSSEPLKKEIDDPVAMDSSEPLKNPDSISIDETSHPTRIEKIVDPLRIEEPGVMKDSCDDVSCGKTGRFPGDENDGKLVSDVHSEVICGVKKEMASDANENENLSQSVSDVKDETESFVFSGERLKTEPLLDDSVAVDSESVVNSSEIVDSKPFLNSSETVDMEATVISSDVVDKEAVLKSGIIESAVDNSELVENTIGGIGEKSKPLGGKRILRGEKNAEETVIEDGFEDINEHPNKDVSKPIELNVVKQMDDERMPTGWDDPVEDNVVLSDSQGISQQDDNLMGELDLFDIEPNTTSSVLKERKSETTKGLDEKNDAGVKIQVTGELTKTSLHEARKSLPYSVDENEIMADVVKETNENINNEDTFKSVHRNDLESRENKNETNGEKNEEGASQNQAEPSLLDEETEPCPMDID